MFSSPFRRFYPGASALFLLSLALSGCGTRQAASVVHPASAAAAKPTPRPTATPQPPRRAPLTVYSVETKQKVFALTFDDGPDPTWTPKVLAILKREKVPATFFMVGTMVRAHTKYAQMVKDGGFTIANHSWSHPSRPRSAIAEIDRTSALIKKTLGVTPTLFRPPYGLLHNGLVDVAKKRGMDAIIWSSAGTDWNHHATANSIASLILKDVSPGGIALLHDGGGNRSQTVAALPRIISTIRGRGYRLVSLSDLLEMGPPTPRGGSGRHRKRRKARKHAPKTKATAQAKPTTPAPKPKPATH